MIIFTEFVLILLHSTRRSSVRVSNASFISQTPNITSIKDPRPLSDRRYQQECATQVVNYLLESGFSQPLGLNNRFMPSTREFAAIFKHLYNKLDPNFRFGARYEEDVTTCLKALNYPFLDSISRSRLVAIGSPHVWPAILGMLHWVVSLIQCTEKAVAMVYTVEQNSLDDHLVDKVLFDYLVRTYHLYLDESPEESEPEKELKATFNQQNQDLYNQTEALKSTNEELINQIKSAEELDSAIQVLEERYRTMQRDEVKFQSAMSGMKSKMESRTNLMKQLQVNIEEKESQLQLLKEKRDSLKYQVENQDISISEFEKMVSEREQLDRNLNMIGSKISELRKEVFDTDLLIQASIDSLEKKVQKFNSLAYRIGIVPIAAIRSANNDFELEINPEGPNYINLDLKNKVRPFINEVRRSITLEFHEEQNKSLKLQEHVDTVNDLIAELQDELRGIESRLTSVLSECNMLRETASEEKNAFDAESDKLERELQQLKLSSHNSMLQLDQRIQSINIEADQIAHACMEYKNNIYKEVAFVLGEIIHFKLHVQDSLEDLKMDYQKELDDLSRSEL